MFSKYLSFVDRVGEAAFAVFMVIIINGYVALSDLNTGFLYIVVVNLGACLSWGIIDGLIYAISSSMERNLSRKKLLQLKAAANKQETTEIVKRSLDGTFLSGFTDEAKNNIAKEIVAYAPEASVGENRLLTKEEMRGWLSIVGIYLAVGFLLALPFLILPDKLLAWILSNAAGVTWVSWYGVQLGKSAGKNRWILGGVMGLVSVVFLGLSYLAWVID